MDPSQVDSLVERLVVNPHDEQALATAHRGGASDPKTYALLLERVGTQTEDAAYASHWLSEAASVWSTTLGDAHRAARVLMQAIERDPTHRTAADRLAELYRSKGDVKALVALLERRAKALAPLASQSPDIRTELTAMHEELGRLWNERLQQPKKAIENFRRAIELEPTNAFAIYGAREIHKGLGQWDEALALYDAERAVEADPARQVALFRDEAVTRRAAGDLAGASRSLARARQIDAQDSALQQEYGATIVERMVAGENVPAQQRTVGAELLVGLAEMYDGEHGFAYSSGALDIEPGHDRALQLYAYYARALGKEDDVASRYLAYVAANPNGAVASEARWLLAASYEGSGDFKEAIQILEPLRTSGDADASDKIRELYGRTGHRPPSTAPPLPPPAEAPADPPLPVPTFPVTSEEVRPDLSPIDAAHALASEGRRDEAFAAFSDILARNPGQAEAQSWIEDVLRTKRDYGALRDVLLASTRASGIATETLQEKLREVAALSESSLHDVDGAIDAWKELLAIDGADDAARQALNRALEKAERWDDLVQLVEDETRGQTDLEMKIVLEKRLAALHEQKRIDFASAAEAWDRVAALVPEDDQAIAHAASLFEKAGAVERAAKVITDRLAGVDDAGARSALFERLGGLFEQLGDFKGAGDAYVEAAESQKSAKLWDSAERCYVAATQWSLAGAAAAQGAEIDSDPLRQAHHFARAAEHFRHGGDDAAFIESLARATELAPANDDFAELLAGEYAAAGRWGDQVALLTKRGDRMADREARVKVRREAAHLYATRLGNRDAAREGWRKVLEDAEDREALERLVDDAVEREDFEEATSFLKRLENIAIGSTDKARIALREAELVAEGVGDVDRAIARYERVLSELDPTSRPALQAIADLQEARDNPSAAADALERELKLVQMPAERGPIAERLARLYELLGDRPNAIRTLDVVRLADPDNFDALVRLCDLCEETNNWAKLAEHLAERIEVEADDEAVGLLTTKLAGVLAEKLDRGEEALAVYEDLANRGDESIRAAYVALGDRLDWRGVVAGKLVEWWFDAKPSPERTSHLRGAFERFADVGRDSEAVMVGCEIARSRGGDPALAERLEQLAIKIGDLDALTAAHDLLARDRVGVERARELVRQAEVQVRAGVPNGESLRHGEEGLTSAPEEEVESLLVRLAAMARDRDAIVGLYERQIGRSKSPGERLGALARAAQVAAAHGQILRARGLFDLALGATQSEETVGKLEQAARSSDAQTGGNDLRRALCAAMADGGKGARDAGRTRAALLRSAASMAYGDLDDVEQALTWLGDALVAHVETATLDMLEDVASDLGEPRRAESAITRALGEVFEAPLVRSLLARRARIRRDELDDKAGAAADLKKLYDLAPTDQTVLDDLTDLLTLLGDHRAMVQLFEDQILRGKDVRVRAALAGKVARLWEGELDDPREAADAWRRVLRMKHGDPEAMSGLDRAKANMLRRPNAALDDDADLPSASRNVRAHSDSSPTTPAVPEDIHLSDQGAAVDAQAEVSTVAPADDVLIADDLAEMIDSDEELDEPPSRPEIDETPTGKRTVPPPLPRT